MEPLENIGRICDDCASKHGPGLYAGTDPAFFVGKYVKMAFPTSPKPADLPASFNWPLFERMWVLVQEAKEGKLYGVLNNDPIFLLETKDGDFFEFETKEIIEYHGSE